MTRPALAPGFADPVGDSQAVFRTVMDAMARPGTVGRLAPRLAPPPPLTPGLAAVALTLCDADTPVWLDPALAEAGAVAAFLRFHTSAPIVTDPAAADFALVLDAASLPPFERFALGTLDYPDRSTTLVIAVDRLDGGTGWHISGPGIDGTARLGVVPLPGGFAARRLALAPLFPRGLDIVFVAGDRVAALPRSTALEG